MLRSLNPALAPKLESILHTYIRMLPRPEKKISVFLLSTVRHLSLVTGGCGVVDIVASAMWQLSSHNNPFRAHLQNLRWGTPNAVLRSLLRVVLRSHTGILGDDPGIQQPSVCCWMRTVSICNAVA